MDTHLDLTAIFEPVEGGWVQGRIEELPAVITAAPTMAEAKSALIDAVREFLLSHGSEEGSPPSVAGALRERINVIIGAA